MKRTKLVEQGRRNDIVPFCRVKLTNVPLLRLQEKAWTFPFLCLGTGVACWSVFYSADFWSGFQSESVPSGFLGDDNNNHVVSFP